MLKQQLHEPLYSAEAIPLGTQSLTVPLMGSNAKAIHDPTQSFLVKLLLLPQPLHHRLPCCPAGGEVAGD